MKAVSYVIFCGLTLLPTLTNSAEIAGAARGCEEVEKYLGPSQSENICRCFRSGIIGRVENEWVGEEAEPVWIGCTRGDMPKVFKALKSLENETRVFKLWIWDSLITVLPGEFFGKIRPHKLIIESSALGAFRSGVFDPLGPYLRTLELKNNIIKDIRGEPFNSLHKLHRLDLSGNKMEKLEEKMFGSLHSLHSLSFYRNSINTVEDGAFRLMKHLKRLNLAGNFIRKITPRTFEGLESLEQLNLENNQIAEIEPGSLDHLKNLKSLNLGSNLLTSVNIQDLPRLESLHLNNNSLSSLREVNLKKLPKLEILTLDKNRLEKVENSSLNALANLKSVSLASNRISKLYSNSFQALNQLKTLSLQNNRLQTLPEGVFYPLRHLTELFLSQNQLTTVGERTLYGLRELKVLSLARNSIKTIHRRAFSYLTSLEKLFLNDNQLNTMENTTFRFQYRSGGTDLLYAVDLSGWVQKHRDQMVHLEETKCREGMVPLNHSYKDLLEKCKQAHPRLLHNPTSNIHNVWITVIGIILGVVSVLILLVIAVMFLQDSGHKRPAPALPGQSVIKNKRKSYDLRRVPSDMVTLIPKCTTVIEKKVRFDLCS